MYVHMAKVLNRHINIPLYMNDKVLMTHSQTVLRSLMGKFGAYYNSDFLNISKTISKVVVLKKDGPNTTGAWMGSL